MARGISSLPVAVVVAEPLPHGRHGDNGTPAAAGAQVGAGGAARLLGAFERLWGTTEWAGCGA